MSNQRPQLAKLTRPRLHGAVARERLFELLDGARPREADFLAGPPGAGKTTLVASWLDVRKLPGIWYQVDSDDADLATFFYYLGHAAVPFTRKRQQPLPALTPEYLHDIPGFTRRFFRELFSRLPNPSMLVLDNLQEVAPDHSFHEVISEAIGQAPGNINVIAITRTDPPAPYSRAIANQDALVIDGDQLKLTIEETKAIATKHVPLTEEQVARVHERSNGWAAGLVLIADRLRHGVILDRLDDAESMRDLFGYFAAQFFDRIPPTDQRTLLELSVLPVMTRKAVEKLSGNALAHRLLEDLHRRRLFTDQLSKNEPAYQFHALFRSFLQHRAEHSFDSTKHVELSRIAALILEEEGFTQQALLLHLQRGDWGAAQTLILRESPRLIGQGRWRTVLDWINDLPDQEISANRWLLYWFGTARLATDPVGARENLERSFALAAEARDDLAQIMGAAGIIQAYILQYTHFRPLDQWIEVLQAKIAAGANFPDSNTELRVQSALLIAFAYRQPDHRGLMACINRLFELLQTGTDDNAKVIAAAYVFAYGTTTGPRELSKKTMPILRSLLDQPGVTAMNAIWSWYLIAWFHTLIGEYGECKQALSQLERIGEDNGLSIAAVKLASIMGAWAEIHAGHIELAEGYSRRLEVVLDPSRLYDVGSHEGIKSWLAVLHNEPRAALDHATRALAFVDQAGSIMHQINYRIHHVWANLLLEDFSAARRGIAEMRLLSRPTQSLWQEIVIRVTEAYIALELDDRPAAENHLRAALSLARESGHDHVPLMRPWMPRLCEVALSAGIETEYVERLIRRFAWAAPSANVEKWPWLVKVYTLGRFDVRVNDRPLIFPHKAPRKPLALLKALVAMGGVRVAEQKLIDAIWGEEEGDTAYQAFWLALHRLRKLLGMPETVRLEDGHLTLNPDLVWTDVRAFEQVLETRDDTSKVRALELYCGSFLSSDLGVPWTVSIRERLRGKFIHHLGQVGRGLESESHWDSAITWYLRGLDADNLTEEFYQGLIRCYIAEGKPAEAMSMFRRLRQTLSVTLGLKPSLATEALIQQLQTG